MTTVAELPANLDRIEDEIVKVGTAWAEARGLPPKRGVDALRRLLRSGKVNILIDPSGQIMWTLSERG